MKRFTEKIYKYFKYVPTESQQELFAKASEFIYGDADVLIVNGYAGTGKTTAISSIVRACRGEYFNVCLLAPTGRAAKVLSSHSGSYASTIHRLIYQQKGVTSSGFGDFKLAHNKSEGTIYVVDEVSLIGVEQSILSGGSFGSSSSSEGSNFGSGNLLDDLITYVREGIDCKLIMIGDSAQLPPVGNDRSPALDQTYMDGYGSCLRCELVEVVRQESESGILANATLIREKIVDYNDSFGFMPDTGFSIELSVEKFPDIERISGRDIVEKLDEAYSKYGEDETIVLCRSNWMANKYNNGIRSMVQFKEDMLTSSDKIMIVKNCYHFVDELPNMDYIANGDIARLERIGNFEEKYGLHYADATITFPDYDDAEIDAKVILDTLFSKSPSLEYQAQAELYRAVNKEYADIISKKKRYEKVKENPYYSALQIKYANAITCHKSQGGQWKCVFINCPFKTKTLSIDELKWLYTALTRAVEKVYLVNFPSAYFKVEKK